MYVTDSNSVVPILHSLCKNGRSCLTVGKTTLCGGGIGRHLNVRLIRDGIEI